MGLFQRKPQTSSNAPLYSLGLHKSVLVVGLGNIGSEFENTRHNVGFACVDQFVDSDDFEKWVDKKDLGCLVSSGNIADTRVIVSKPTTLMNNSGQAVQKIAHFYKIPASSVLVVHDELDVPFGQIRMRLGGGAAGHNGIKSLVQHIGEGFNRIRIGIGSEEQEGRDSADFVLSKFNKTEQSKIPLIIREVCSLTTEFVAGGELPHDTRNVIG